MSNFWFGLFTGALVTSIVLFALCEFLAVGFFAINFKLVKRLIKDGRI